MISDAEDSERGQKRRFQRRPVRLEATVEASGRALSGTTENISPGGAFLRVELPQATDDLTVKFALPNGKEMQVRARVCWRAADGVGIAFEQFLPEPPHGDGPWEDPII